MTKVSLKRSRMGENTSAWETQALQELVSQHPWISSYRTRAVISKDDEQGFGVGFIEVTHKTKPTKSTDEDRKVVTFPILIDSYELAPFDVCYYAGRYMPATQSRLELLLRSASSMTVPTAAESYDAYYINRLRNWNEQANNTPYKMLSGVKFASLKAPNKDELISLIYQDILHADQAIDRDKVSAWAKSVRDESVEEFESLMKESKGRQWLRQHVPMRVHEHGPNCRCKLRPKSSSFTEEFLSRHQKCLGVEVRRSESSFEHRAMWASSPDDGRAKMSSWKPATFIEVNTSIPDANVSELMETGRTFVSGVVDDPSIFDPILDTEKTSSVRALLEEAEPLIKEAQHIESRLETATIDLHLEKISALKAGAVYTAVCGTKPGSPEAALFCKMVKEHTYFRHVYSLSGASSRRLRSVGFLFADGTVLFSQDQYDITRCCSFVYAEGKESEVPDTPVRVFPLVKGSDEINPVMNDSVPSGWFTCQDGACLFFQGTDAHEVTVDGMRGYKLNSSEGDYGDAVVLISPIKRIIIQPNFGDSGTLAHTYLHLPRTKTKYFEFNHPGSDIDTASPGDIEDVVKLISYTDSSEGRDVDVVKMSSSNDGVIEVTLESAGEDHFSFRADRAIPLVDARGVLSEHQTKVSCAAAGIGPKCTRALMQIVRAHGTKTVKVSAPSYHAGALEVGALDEETREVAQTIEKVASVVESERESLVDTMVDLYAGMKFGHVKASKSFTSTIDGALSLGFLTQSNMVRIVDQLPMLEDLQGFLCTLLVASRLGLREIPEQETTEAVRGIEKILSGLKSLEYVLRFA